MIVCGFADPAGVVAGVAWRLGEESGGVLLAGDAVSAAEVELETGDSDLNAGFSAGDASAELSMPWRVGDPDGGPSRGVAEGRVEFQLHGKKRSLNCPAHAVGWATDPRQGAELVRHLAIPHGDDGLLLLVARRPEGAEGHADEEVSAWRFGSEGAAGFEEALVSTQYDEEGLQTRVGLELWSGEEGETHPIRAAGTAAGVVEAGAVRAALLHTSAEGRDGLGDYLIWRA